jgi:high-affinity Fe2+/Pb2+ permease
MPIPVKKSNQSIRKEISMLNIIIGSVLAIVLILAGNKMANDHQESGWRLLCYAIAVMLFAIMIAEN